MIFLSKIVNLQFVGKWQVSNKTWLFGLHELFVRLLNFVSLNYQEGQGRQNRKLAVAYHKRRSGRSVFIIAYNTKGVLSTTDDSFIGLVTANLMGSRYYVWNKVKQHDMKGLKLHSLQYQQDQTQIATFCICITGLLSQEAS